MAAVTARVAEAPRATTGRRSSRPTGTTRRRRRLRLRGALKFAVPVLFLVAVFSFVNVHAKVTTTSYSKSDLQKQYRLEQIRNERLRLELIRITSPKYVVGRAERIGMIPAAQYDYLVRTDTVASAGR